MYRVPWRLSTSPTVAIRVTEGCGLDCCSGRCAPIPLEQVRSNLERVNQSPRVDSIVLVGGEPARHPEIMNVVKLAHEIRNKVVLCTNGYDLTSERLSEMRDAGLWGVNLRVNRSQQRPGWRESSDIQIEGLRSHLAEMVAGVGGLLCSFEIEVSDGGTRELADVLAWAERHVDRVQRLVLTYTTPDVTVESASRPRDLADNWRPAGFIADEATGDSTATITWRIGRRGNEILAASSRLLRLLCEYHESTHRRSFAYLSLQSLRSQFLCWLATLSDMSLRPLAREVFASLWQPSKLISPRLASQFLFSLDQPCPPPSAVCPGDSYDSLSTPVESMASG